MPLVENHNSKLTKQGKNQSFSYTSQCLDVVIDETSYQLVKSTQDYPWHRILSMTLSHCQQISICH